MKKEKTLEQFATILDAKNPQKAYEFFNLDFSECTDDAVLQMEMQLFEQDWHSLHDELARSYQIKRDPVVVDFLCKAVVLTTFD